MDLDLKHGWQLHEQEVEAILKQLSTQHSFKNVIRQYAWEYIDLKKFSEKDVYDFLEAWDEEAKESIDIVLENISRAKYHKARDLHGERLEKEAFERLTQDIQEDVKSRLDLLMSMPIEALEQLAQLRKKFSKLAA